MTGGTQQQVPGTPVTASGPGGGQAAPVTVLRSRSICPVDMVSGLRSSLVGSVGEAPGSPSSTMRLPGVGPKPLIERHSEGPVVRQAQHLFILLGVFAEQGAEAGYRLLHLGVHKDNPARAPYEQAGYQPAGSDGDYLLYDLAVGTAGASRT
jgi:hypothetical protein